MVSRQDFTSTSEVADSQRSTLNDHPAVMLPDASFLYFGSFEKVGFDLVITNAEGETFIVEIYFSKDSFQEGGAPGDTNYGFSMVGDTTGKEPPAPAAPPPAAPEVTDEMIDQAMARVLGERLDSVAGEAAREVVRELLPQIAEKLVREEIDRD